MRLEELDEEQFGPEAARALRAQRMKGVLSVSYISAVTNWATAVTVASIFSGLGRDVWIVAWAVAMTALMASAVFARWRLGDRTSGSKRMPIALAQQAFLVSALWGLFPFIVLDVSNATHQVVLVGQCIAFMAVGPLSFVSVPRAALTWLVVGAVLGTIAVFSMGGILSIGSLLLIPFACVIGRVLIVQASTATRQFGDAQAVREQREVIDLLLRDYENTSSEWRWQSDAEGMLTRIPDALLQVLGWTEEQMGSARGSVLLGQSAEPRSQRDVSRMATMIAERQSFHDIEVAIRDKTTGHVRWINLRGNPTFDEGGRYLGYRGIATEVTEMREAKDKAQYLLKYDALTGLANRVTMKERIEKQIARGQPFSVIALDLDRFKQVNDTMGHPVGDELLRAVAERLEALSAPKDTLIARVSGDEFFVIGLPTDDTSRLEADVAALAKRIVATVAKPYDLAAGTAVIGTSVGTAQFPKDGETLDDLMSRVDIALYEAKAAGRGTVRAYHPRLDEDARRRRGIEADLRSALERGEFSLMFQPIVSMKATEHTSHGMEALLRWSHPERGLVPPCDFIPVAEETGLILTIGEWALRRACLEASGWRNPLRVTVNVSADQLLANGFPAVVMSALAAAELPPSRLELDVSETVLLRDPEGVLAVVAQIRSMGVRVALDDFGDGFATLCAMRDLAFDTIKIDRSFVRDLDREDEEHSRVVVGAMLGLAARLGITTAAEGIERASQAELLLEMGCLTAQGYLFARPESSDDAAARAGGRIVREIETAKPGQAEPQRLSA